MGGDWILMKIKVTQEHIQSGSPRQSQHCPVALAIKEHFPPDCIVRIGNPHFKIGKCTGRFPDSISSMITRFDMSGQMEPFEFYIYSGVSWIETIKTHRVELTATMKSPPEFGLNDVDESLATSVPLRLKESIDRYARHGVPTGGFLRAVLSNDLMSAIRRADNTSLNSILAICQYIHNAVPSAIRGSREAVEAHLRKAQDAISD